MLYITELRSEPCRHAFTRVLYNHANNLMKVW